MVFNKIIDFLAWYDRHREQILHGNQSNYEDKSLDVFQYFTTSCYDGFNDSNPKNFYKVYADVFNQIATEDIEYMDDNEDFESIPRFGDSKSDYEEVVEPFYTYFESYSTKKSYAWLFTHNINEIRDRKFLKLIEKEHKKIQQKARKERNEEIRSLVLFVKKRDKRVIEYKKIVEEKLHQNRLKSQQNRLDQIKKRQQELDDQLNKSKNHEHDAQLKELEKSYFDQYTDSEEELEDSQEDENLENDMEHLGLDENQELYCIACDKFFSNPSSFKNHEESKKHKQNVSLIKQEMQEEETNFTNNIENGSAEDEAEVETESQIKSSKKSKKSKKNKKKQIVQEPVSEEEPEEVKDILQLDNSDKEDSWNENKGNKKSKNKKIKTKTGETEPNPVATNPTKPVEKIEKPQKKNQKSQKTEPPKSETVDVDHVCVTCNKTFNSKNKLFNHLKETKHSVFLDKMPAKAGKSKK